MGSTWAALLAGSNAASSAATTSRAMLAMMAVGSAALV